MTAADLIEQARAAGVVLRLEGGRVGYRGGDPRALQALLPKLRKHRDELAAALAALEASATPADTVPSGRGQTIWWRFMVTAADSQTVEVDFASGATLAEAQRHILTHLYPGARRIRPTVRYPVDGQVEVQDGRQA